MQAHQKPGLNDDGRIVAESREAQADNGMFESYSRLEIHEVMLKDFPRTDAYRQAIVQGRAHFDGKAVLDVGCGLGILSMLAARLGGARVVYAVEASAETAARAKEVVSRNGLDGIVRVVVGRIEDIELPEKVDVIISEWMGYFMVHESMLESVLLARDKWLLPDGHMYPSSARLILCPGNFQKQLDECAGFWTADVYGFDFSSLRAEAEAALRREPVASGTLEAQQLVQGALPAMLADFDLGKCTKAEVRNIRSTFSFSLPKQQGLCEKRRKAVTAVHGFALWFDVSFPCGVRLSTSPHDPDTHWGQTITFLDETLELLPGSSITGTLQLTANVENHRFYDLTIELEDLDQDCAAEAAGNGVDDVLQEEGDDEGDEWPFPIRLPDSGYATASRDLIDGEVLLRVDPLFFSPGGLLDAVAIEGTGTSKQGSLLQPLILAALEKLPGSRRKRRPPAEQSQEEDEREAETNEDDSEDVVQDSWADLDELLKSVPMSDRPQSEPLVEQRILDSVFTGALRKKWTQADALNLCKQLRSRALSVPAEHLGRGGAGLYPSLFGFNWLPGGGKAANCAVRVSSHRPSRVEVVAMVSNGSTIPAGTELTLHVSIADSDTLCDPPEVLHGISRAL